MKLPKDLSFVTFSRVQGNNRDILMTVNHRHPAWFKAAFKAWIDAAKEKWYSPVFWLFITPRFIVRLVLLAYR